jgi:hypothetical protein
VSELTTFRDHARRMATSGHKPECEGTPERVAERTRNRMGYRAIFREHHPKLEPIEPCPGCVTDADRALWARLAAEVDAYLSHDEEGALFG